MSTAFGSRMLLRVLKKYSFGIAGDGNSRTATGNRLRHNVAVPGKHFRQILIAGAMWHIPLRRRQPAGYLSSPPSFHCQLRASLAEPASRPRQSLIKPSPKNIWARRGDGEINWYCWSQLGLPRDIDRD